MGEHTIRYEFLAAQMGKIGFACYSIDHQGMGASEGDRCYVERFSHYVQDFNAFVAHVLSLSVTLGLWINKTRSLTVACCTTTKNK